MKFLQYTFTTIAFFLGSQIAWADDAATQALIQDLSLMQKTQGEFAQTIYDNQQHVLQQSQGKFALSKVSQSSDKNANGKFRWEVATPSPLLLIADGKTIWIYDKELAQVTKKKQQGASNKISPAILLSSDLTQLSKNYNISQHTENDKQLFILKPKSKNDDTLFEQLQLIFATAKTSNQPVLTAMAFKDSFGHVTQIQFSNLQNKATDDLFNFVRPAGVDVVDAGT